MDEETKLTQLEKLISRIDFRIEVLKKKRKDVTLDMMVEIVRDANTSKEKSYKEKMDEKEFEENYH